MTRVRRHTQRRRRRLSRRGAHTRPQCPTLCGASPQCAGARAGPRSTHPPPHHQPTPTPPVCLVHPVAVPVSHLLARQLLVALFALPPLLQERGRHAAVADNVRRQLAQGPQRDRPKPRLAHVQRERGAYCHAAPLRSAPARQPTPSISAWGGDSLFTQVYRLRAQTSTQRLQSNSGALRNCLFQVVRTASLHLLRGKTGWPAALAAHNHCLDFQAPIQARASATLAGKLGSASCGAAGDAPLLPACCLFLQAAIQARASATLAGVSAGRTGGGAVIAAAAAAAAAFLAASRSASALAAAASAAFFAVALQSRWHCRSLSKKGHQRPAML